MNNYILSAILFQKILVVANLGGKKSFEQREKPGIEESLARETPTGQEIKAIPCVCDFGRICQFR